MRLQTWICRTKLTFQTTNFLKTFLCCGNTTAGNRAARNCHSLHLLFLKALIVGGFEHGSMLLKASFLGPMQAKLLPRNLVLSLRTKHNPEPAEIHRYGYDSRYSKAIGSAAAIAGPVQPRSPVSSYILTTKSLGAKVEKRFLKISKPFARHAISANPMTTPSNPVDGTHRSVAGLQRHT